MDERALLEEAGTALFGADWKPALRDALNVDSRSLRSWLQTGTIPTGVWREIHDLLAQRAELARTLCERISTRTASPD